MQSYLLIFLKTVFRIGWGWAGQVIGSAHLPWYRRQSRNKDPQPAPMAGHVSFGEDSVVGKDEGYKGEKLENHFNWQNQAI